MERLLKESDRLRRGAESVLRHAVESRRVGADAHDSIHRSLRALCRVARAYGVHVEQVVIVCKDVWRTLPEARELPPETGSEVLKGLISQCIDEFYRTDGAHVGASHSRDVAATDASFSFMLGPLS